MTAAVAVIGAGYAGVTVARALDDIVDVVLVEPRDAFVHNLAVLRGVTDRDWTERIFIPYDRLLTRGRVCRDRAVEVSATAVRPTSGEVLDRRSRPGQARPRPRTPAPVVPGHSGSRSGPHDFSLI
ncbi:hypothetical protein [Streptomyces sp. CNQ085]|uniref:hypothetical protein n=1 Tax=Streptomyces sp. CNQ085 TaxID=2886944 RepID=UPI001F50EB86|nr:hypothetical protein [Streptomyces sp. CNQ085]MCI0386091.1 hypothetical protein [Streptomyces sp. CNQ085]